MYIRKIDKTVSKRKSLRIKEAKWREENKAWLNRSFTIALQIMNVLKARSITTADLADEMDVSIGEVNRIVKGQENLSLETISKLEKALGIELIGVKWIK